MIFVFYLNIHPFFIVFPLSLGFEKQFSNLYFGIYFWSLSGEAYYIAFGLLIDVPNGIQSLSQRSQSIKVVIENLLSLQVLATKFFSVSVYTYLVTWSSSSHRILAKRLSNSS